MRVNTIHRGCRRVYLNTDESRTRPGRTVISSRLINGIICQVGDSNNINLSGMTAIKRLLGTKTVRRSGTEERGKRRSRKEGEWRRSLQFKRANARLRGKLTTNVTLFKDSRGSLSGSLGTSLFSHGYRWDER